MSTRAHGRARADWFEPGQVIHGKYELLRLLGAGGVGYVVAARHIGFDDLVALKFLRPEFATRCGAHAERAQHRPRRRFERSRRARAAESTAPTRVGADVVVLRAYVLQRERPARRGLDHGFSRTVAVS